jgi:alkylhydroperoxidase/carboxymuconolactone decarboxylase family protein YurZ
MISESFKAFLAEAPHQSKAWMEVVEALGAASALDPKTKALCYLSVLATARMTSGVPFHARLARSAGASRSEVISAVLVGLPAVGQAIVESIGPALQGFDAEG